VRGEEKRRKRGRDMMKKGGREKGDPCFPLRTSGSGGRGGKKEQREEAVTIL